MPPIQIHDQRESGKSTSIYPKRKYLIARAQLCLGSCQDGHVAVEVSLLVPGSPYYGRFSLEMSNLLRASNDTGQLINC